MAANDSKTEGPAPVEATKTVELVGPPRRRTKTDILIDAAVEIYKAQAELDLQVAKIGLALQGVTSSMSAPIFDRYMKRVHELEEA